MQNDSPSGCVSSSCVSKALAREMKFDAFVFVCRSPRNCLRWHTEADCQIGGHGFFIIAIQIGHQLKLCHFNLLTINVDPLDTADFVLQSSDKL